MGAPKLKWTSEEEGALRAGVEKYGAGKWRTILKDPEFAPCLQARSNVDLKDKWRNLTSSVSRSGRGSKSPGQKLIAPGPLSLAAPCSPATAVSAAAANSDTANLTSPSTSTTVINQMPRCDNDDMMLEVIAPMQNANETDRVIFATSKEMDFINKASMNCLPAKISEEDAMFALAEAAATTTEDDNDLLWLIESATEAENDVIWSDEAATEADNDILLFMKMAEEDAVTEAEIDAILAADADMLPQSAS